MSFSQSQNTNSMLPMPPIAHMKTQNIVSQQPNAASSMSVAGGQQSQSDESAEKPMRLRGGCIPCPVSFILSLHTTRNSKLDNALGWRILLDHPNSVLLLLSAEHPHRSEEKASEFMTDSMYYQKKYSEDTDSRISLNDYTRQGLYITYVRAMDIAILISLYTRMHSFFTAQLTTASDSELVCVR